MDLQTSLVYVAVVVISAAVILFVSMFAIKEKSYEEAIAEQRKLPDDLLLGKKDKGKEKKHKNKTGKKVKEKKDDSREERDEKSDEKSDHVQFEDTSQILTSDASSQEACKISKKKNKVEKVKPILVNKDEPPIVAADSAATAEILPIEVNHFEAIHPKDDLELIRSQSKENLSQHSPTEPPANKSPKDTPTKSGKKSQKPIQKKEVSAVDASAPVLTAPVTVAAPVTPTSSPGATVATASPTAQPPVKEPSKKNKKKNDILTQIGSDKDSVNISLLMPLLQNAELSRSEIQILVEQLLNKQQDNPVEHSEWTEGRSDPVIKLKKQLAEKDKALAEEHESSQTFQNRIKELRAELTSERSRATQVVKQLEEALSIKITEAQTLHARMQHIFETHSAEKQRFSTQIDQLQSKINDDAAIIHKIQAEQGQAQGHLQKELNAQRQQLEAQFVQIRESEKTLQAQLTQKHHEVQELQNVNMAMTQELQATCESSTAEIEMLRQQLGMMQEQYMHADAQLQHLKESNDRLQEMAHQLEDSHRAQSDLDHRLKNALRHEQDQQKQIHSLQNELKLAKVEVGELTKAESELLKLRSDLMNLQNEAKKDVAKIMNMREHLSTKDDQLAVARNDVKIAHQEVKNLEMIVDELKAEVTDLKLDVKICHDNDTMEVQHLKTKLLQAEESAKISNEDTVKMKNELELLQNNINKEADVHLHITKLEEENYNLLVKIEVLEKETSSLKERLAQENGLAETDNVDTRLLEEREAQIENLKTELAKKSDEFDNLNKVVEEIKNDVKSQTAARIELEQALEAQKSKNNELRTKNWKVMEALSAAENRSKKSIKSTDENLEEIRLSEQESTKSLLQRIFPDIKIEEASYEKWLTAFEGQVRVVLTAQTTEESESELEAENKRLQTMVSHSKKIIEDAGIMLKSLQNQAESTELNWQSEMKLKEDEIIKLRIEITDLTHKCSENDILQKKVIDLESRLTEGEAARLQNSNHLAELEQIQEEQQKLMQELENERSNGIHLDSELNKLRDLISKHEAETARLTSECCGASSTPDQSSANEPPSESSQPEQQTSTTESNENKVIMGDNSTVDVTITSSTTPPQPHLSVKSDVNSMVTEFDNDYYGQRKRKNKKKRKSTKKATSKRRRFAGWFRKKVTTRTKLR